jgi:hypothetical protein
MELFKAKDMETIPIQKEKPIRDAAFTALDTLHSILQT